MFLVTPDKQCYYYYYYYYYYNICIAHKLKQAQFRGTVSELRGVMYIICLLCL